MKKNFNSMFLKEKLKKTLCILLLLMFSLIPLLAEPCGDVDSNSEIDIVDALLIAQYYVDLNPRDFDEGAADVDGDGIIDIVDALLIAQYYVDLISELPGCVVPPTPGPTGLPHSGIITINDPITGWATMSGGTTGGGTNMSNATTVSSMSALRNAISGSGAKIVLVEPGSYSGNLSPDANTTIIGTAPGVTIKGHITISGSGKNNIIIRNIAVRDNKCSGSGCKSGSDGVYIGSGAHHVWFDHCDIADGQDGNFDVTRSGDFITVSWTKFWYTYDKEHKFSNLIAGSDGETESRGKLNITYMNCWWGERVEQRQPRGRFGKIHVFNCLYTSQNTASEAYLCGPGVEMAMIIQNNYFAVPGSTPAIREWGSSKGWLATGNEGTASGMNSSKGSVFDIPYSYSLVAASQVNALVSASVGGAGNTCTFRQ